MDLLGLIRRLPEIIAYNKFDDDLFDRLNYSHTVAILTVLAIIVTNQQFSENQIKCWVPAQFTGNYEQYVNQMCFITNTYSFDMHESLPDDYSQRHERELKYYQWTPFILLIMAILFYIPHQFWRGLSLRSGVDLKDLIEAAQTYRSANIQHEDKIKLLDYLTNWVNNYCSNAYRLTKLQTKKPLSVRQAKIIHFGYHLCFPVGIYTGNYLIISYLFIKFLYLFNSIGQILLLNTLLGRNFWFYGIEIIYRYWTKQIGLLYSGNEYFPKVVFCDFTVREPNHPKESHRYTVQCVLPFNLFNQQIFTYLYFWLIILSFFNIISIIMWIYRISPCPNFHYLQRRLTLQLLTNNHHAEIDLRRKFTYQYLKGDGTFMLRLVESNVSDYVCRRIIVELYKVFYGSLKTGTIDREPLFHHVFDENFNDDIDKDDTHNQNDTDEVNDDISTNQNIADEIPPVPNPRQGKIFVEQDASQKLPSDLTDIGQDETPKTDTIPMPTDATSSQTRSRTSLIPLLKEAHRASQLQIDFSDITAPRYKNVHFYQESSTRPSSQLTCSSMPPLHRLPSSPTIKGPLPYATTYLTTIKRNEHELPYIDDSISSGSIYGRLASTNVCQQTEKPKIILASTNPFYQRSHDV